MSSERIDLKLLELGDILTQTEGIYLSREKTRQYTMA